MSAIAGFLLGALFVTVAARIITRLDRGTGDRAHRLAAQLARARSDDYMAIADAVREDPRPVLLTADDQPQAATILRDDEYRVLTSLAPFSATLPTMAHNGGVAADFLRERFPSLPDAELGRIALTALWIMKNAAEACDDNPLNHLAAHTQALAGAALHLTELERMDAP